MSNLILYSYSPSLMEGSGVAPLTLFIPKDSQELRFLSTFANINRQINRNL